MEIKRDKIVIKRKYLSILCLLLISNKYILFLLKLNHFQIDIKQNSKNI